MELYSAKIQLDGSRDNEVRRTDLTAAEVLILCSMHGREHVQEIKIVGEVERTPNQERLRLYGIEGETPSLYQHKVIKTVFPSDFTPLPDALPPDMIAIDAMAADLNKPVVVEKPVEEMSAEEIDAELKLADARRGYLAKARKAKAENAAKATAASQTQASALD